jgi:hypothetical protein
MCVCLCVFVFVCMYVCVCVYVCLRDRMFSLCICVRTTLASPLRFCCGLASVTLTLTEITQLSNHLFNNSLILIKPGKCRKGRETPSPHMSLLIEAPTISDSVKAPRSLQLYAQLTVSAVLQLIHSCSNLEGS